MAAPMTEWVKGMVRQELGKIRAAFDVAAGGGTKQPLPLGQALALLRTVVGQMEVLRGVLAEADRGRRYEVSVQLDGPLPSAAFRDAEWLVASAAPWIDYDASWQGENRSRAFVDLDGHGALGMLDAGEGGADWELRELVDGSGGSGIVVPIRDFVLRGLDAHAQLHELASTVDGGHNVAELRATMERPKAAWFGAVRVSLCVADRVSARDAARLLVYPSVASTFVLRSLGAQPRHRYANMAHYAASPAALGAWLLRLEEMRKEDASPELRRGIRLFTSDGDDTSDPDERARSAVWVVAVLALLTQAAGPE
jgi:hypothetical protein